ncbi:energy transducer TonB [Candidatus Woesearchaeota archaeon]|jgi:TonB family protein|nr:energy transducer TonB [Candidatus Woesearchaeota archaeon]MBT7830911.1 energy transducer TonB [Candidatus Neomarinimicrobiota bacterium]
MKIFLFLFLITHSIFANQFADGLKAITLLANMQQYKIKSNEAFVVKQNGKYYQKFSSTPFTGVGIEIKINIFKKITLKDGIENGTIEVYNENGYLIKKGQYKNGKLINKMKIINYPTKKEKNKINKQTKSKQNNWIESEHIDPMTDTKLKIVSTTSLNRVNYSNATLSIRYKENKDYEVVINFGQTISATKFDYRIDKNKVKHLLNTSPSTNKKALFINNAFDFIQELVKGKELIVQIEANYPKGTYDIYKFNIINLNKKVTTKDLSEKVKKKKPKTNPNYPIGAKYLKNNSKLLTQIINKNLKYPSLAIRLKQFGIVAVEFDLKKNGNIDNLKIINSSQYEILDKCALDTINKSYKEFPKPKEDITIEFPINFELY